MNGGNLPARRIVIKLTAREKNDPAAMLAAVRSALGAQGLSLQVRAPKADPADAIEAEVVKDEPLETKARELAASVLDREAARAEKERVEHELKIERVVAEITAQRQGSAAYLRFLALKFVRISVEIYEKGADVFGSFAKITKVIFTVGEPTKRE